MHLCFHHQSSNFCSGIIFATCKANFTNCTFSAVCISNTELHQVMWLGSGLQVGCVTRNDSRNKTENCMHWFRKFPVFAKRKLPFLKRFLLNKFRTTAHKLKSLVSFIYFGHFCQKLNYFQKFYLETRIQKLRLNACFPFRMGVS